MKQMLKDLLSIMNDIEVKGEYNLARLYNSIDIVKKLLSAVPEEIIPTLEESSDGQDIIE